MGRISDSPLKPEHCLCLDRVLERCPKVRQVIAACQELGLPVETAMQELEAHEKLANGLKKAFFPERV